MFRYTTSILGLLSLVLPTVTATLDSDGKCNANNCYRALLQTEGHFSTRGGTLECSSFLVTTVTPGVATVYSTLTFTRLATSDVTLTTIQTVEETATATVTSTSTVSTAPAAKREVRTLAAWASNACGPDVTARFSSACSCLGVTATVVTAAASSATVYVSVSTTATTVATVATESSLTTETTATTTRTTVTLVTPTPVCMRTDACTITGPGTYREACGGQGECVCNILYGAGFNGVCAGCISDGNFCFTDGPDPNCCSGYCDSYYCRAS